MADDQTQIQILLQLINAPETLAQLEAVGASLDQIQTLARQRIDLRLNRPADIISKYGSVPEAQRANVAENFSRTYSAYYEDLASRLRPGNKDFQSFSQTVYQRLSQSGNEAILANLPDLKTFNKALSDHLRETVRRTMANAAKEIGLPAGFPAVRAPSPQYSIFPQQLSLWPKTGWPNYVGSDIPGISAGAKETKFSDWTSADINNLNKQQEGLRNWAAAHPRLIRLAPFQERVTSTFDAMASGGIRPPIIGFDDRGMPIRDYLAEAIRSTQSHKPDTAYLSSIDQKFRGDRLEFQRRAREQRIEYEREQARIFGTQTPQTKTDAVYDAMLRGYIKTPVLVPGKDPWQVGFESPIMTEGLPKPRRVVAPWKYPLERDYIAETVQRAAEFRESLRPTTMRRTADSYDLSTFDETSPIRRVARAYDDLLNDRVRVPTIESFDSLLGGRAPRRYFPPIRPRGFSESAIDAGEPPRGIGNFFRNIWSGGGGGGGGLRGTLFGGDDGGGLGGLPSSVVHYGRYMVLASTIGNVFGAIEAGVRRVWDISQKFDLGTRRVAYVGGMGYDQAHATLFSSVYGGEPTLTSADDRISAFQYAQRYLPRDQASQQIGLARAAANFMSMAGRRISAEDAVDTLVSLTSGNTQISELAKLRGDSQPYNVILDMLAKSYQLTGIDPEEMASAVRQSQGAISSGKFTMPQYIATVDVLSKATGESFAAAAATMRTGAENYQRPEARDILTKLGVPIFDDTNRTQTRGMIDVLTDMKTLLDEGTISALELQEALNDIFGPRQASRYGALITNIDKIPTTATEVSDNLGEHKRLQEIQSQSLEAQFQRFKDNIERSFVESGQMKSLVDIVSGANFLMSVPMDQTAGMYRATESFNARNLAPENPLYYLRARAMYMNTLASTGNATEAERAVREFDFGSKDSPGFTGVGQELLKTFYVKVEESLAKAMSGKMTPQELEEFQERYAPALTRAQAEQYRVYRNKTLPSPVDDFLVPGGPDPGTGAVAAPKKPPPGKFPYREGVYATGDLFGRGIFSQTEIEARQDAYRRAEADIKSELRARLDAQRTKEGDAPLTDAEFASTEAYRKIFDQTPVEEIFRTPGGFRTISRIPDATVGARAEEYYRRSMGNIPGIAFDRFPTIPGRSPYERPDASWINKLQTLIDQQEKAILGNIGSRTDIPQDVRDAMIAARQEAPLQSRSYQTSTGEVAVTYRDSDAFSRAMDQLSDELSRLGESFFRYTGMGVTKDQALRALEASEQLREALIAAGASTEELKESNLILRDEFGNLIKVRTNDELFREALARDQRSQVRLDDTLVPHIDRLRDINLQTADTMGKLGIYVDRNTQAYAYGTNEQGNYIQKLVGPIDSLDEAIRQLTKEVRAMVPNLSFFPELTGGEFAEAQAFAEAQRANILPAMGIDRLPGQTRIGFVEGQPKLYYDDDVMRYAFNRQNYLKDLRESQGSGDKVMKSLAPNFVNAQPRHSGHNWLEDANPPKETGRDKQNFNDLQLDSETWDEYIRRRKAEEGVGEGSILPGSEVKPQGMVGDASKVYVVNLPGSIGTPGQAASGELTAGPGVQQHAEMINRYAKQYGVDPVLIASLIEAESGGNARARNPNEPSFGLFQFYTEGPAGRGRGYGISEDKLFDPEFQMQNIMPDIAAAVKRHSGTLSGADLAAMVGKEVLRPAAGNEQRYAAAYRSLMERGAVPMPVAGTITQPYGDGHYGVDIAAPQGAPVYAPIAGTVKKIASQVGKDGQLEGWGHYVELEHPGGDLTRYAHLSRYPEGLQPGQQVAPGQVIGYVGSTGSSTGPHLHWEAEVDGKRVGPDALRGPAQALFLPSNEAAFWRIENKAPKKDSFDLRGWLEYFLDMPEFQEVTDPSKPKSALAPPTAQSQSGLAGGIRAITGKPVVDVKGKQVQNLPALIPDLDKPGSTSVVSSNEELQKQVAQVLTQTEWHVSVQNYLGTLPNMDLTLMQMRDIWLGFSNGQLKFAMDVSFPKPLDVILHWAAGTAQSVEDAVKPTVAAETIEILARILNDEGVAIQN